MMPDDRSLCASITAGKEAVRVTAPSPLAMISCSYAPDRDRCRRLCQSVDRWVDPAIRHYLVVPARDRQLFQALAGSRREIVSVEDILPGTYRQLPFIQRWWLSPGGQPVRGWILQQITKLCADRITQAEYLLFADSDLLFLRPFDATAVLDDDHLRLHRIPGAANSGRHLRWHHRAADLLNVERRYFGADYIGQLITWRRSRLTGLKRHIERSQGRAWDRCIARSWEFSEYILYGAYVDAVLGEASSGHYATADDLCHCCWFRDEAEALGSGSQPLRDGAYALLLQSNLGLSHAEETVIVERLGLCSARTLETC
jgi:hypothetical protein